MFGREAYPALGLEILERGWPLRSGRRPEARGAVTCGDSRRISARVAVPRESRAAGFSRGSSGRLVGSVLPAAARIFSGGATGGGGTTTSDGAVGGVVLVLAMSGC